MNAQVLESSKTDLSLSLKKSDIGTLYIVQHELLKDANTDFAGVIVKHPLTNECWLKVTAKGGPAKEIAKAADAAIKNTEDLEKLFAKMR